MNTRKHDQAPPVPTDTKAILHTTVRSDVPDGGTVGTLCGLTLTMSRTATAQAQESMPWESCPVCEAISFLRTINIQPDQGVLW